MACKLLHRGKQGNEGKRQREICIRGGSPAYEGNVYDIRIMRAWVFLLRRATVPSRCPIRTTDLSFSPLLLLVLLSSPFLTFSKSHFETTLLDRGKENESAFPSVCARRKGKIHQRAFYGLFEVERRTGALPSRCVSLFPPSHGCYYSNLRATISASRDRSRITY